MDIIENKINQIKSASGKIFNAHEYLYQFLADFHKAERGGIHDFIEISLYNMVNLAISNINDYLKTGHKQVSATEIMHIVVDSYQKVLDGMKRNLDGMDRVNFK
jgi:hypothetical protein